MDYQTIVLLILAGLLAMSIMTIAGLVLSARSFTQLAELIRYIGSNLVQQHQETRQAVTTLSGELEKDTNSVQKDTTRTMPDNQSSNTTE